MRYTADNIGDLFKLIKSPDVRVEFCERFDEKSEIWNLSIHSHDCIELMYIIDGNVEMNVGGETYNSHYNDVVIYPKGMYHKEDFSRSGHTEVFCVWINAPGLEFDHAINIKDRKAQLRIILEQLHGEYKRTDADKIIINSYVYIGAVALARLYFENTDDRNPVNITKEYLRVHWNEPVCLEELAKLNHVSKSYLCRVFRRETGMSVVEYISSIRISKAIDMLIYSNNSIKQITYDIGYNSPKYFCRVFEKYLGMSPRDYSKQNKAI